MWTLTVEAQKISDMLDSDPTMTRLTSQGSFTEHVRCEGLQYLTIPYNTLHHPNTHFVKTLCNIEESLHILLQHTSQNDRIWLVVYRL